MQKTDVNETVYLQDGQVQIVYLTICKGVASDSKLLSTWWYTMYCTGYHFEIYGSGRKGQMRLSRTSVFISDKCF